MSAAEPLSDVSRIHGVPDTPSIYSKKWWLFLGGVVAVATSVFHLVSNGLWRLPQIDQRGLHLMLILAMVFLFVRADGKSGSEKPPSRLDILFLLASVFVGIHVMAVGQRYMEGFFHYDYFDLGVGVLAIVVLCEASRRTSGYAVPILVGLSLAYTLWGSHLPGTFAHSGFAWERVVSHAYLGTDGIFGLVLGVSSTYIALFVLLGAFMRATGVGDFFTELAFAVSGRSRGGPAKVAIFASALMGTVTGSTSSNVATTGAITIPMMLRAGYPRVFAPAVEATAAAGGQIMPPIMGSAAFVMADVLGVPYATIATAAIVPSMLYFLALYLNVHLTAVRLDLSSGVAAPQPLWPLLRSRGYQLTPLLLVLAMLIGGWPPLSAGFWSIVSVIALSYMRRDTRLTPTKFLLAMEEGARTLLAVAVACAAIGILLATVSLTGVALSLANDFIALAGENLLILLLLTAFASLILGLELPAVACYIILAIVAAPALVKLGVEPLAAHFFVYFFGIFSTLTPPVCTGAFTAAAIAGAPPMRTGMVACLIAGPCYLVPFVIVYDPVLLFIDWAFWGFVRAAVPVALGVAVFAAGSAGYLIRPTKLVERILLCVSGALLVAPSHFLGGTGLALLAVVVAMQLIVRPGGRPAPGSMVRTTQEPANEPGDPGAVRPPP